MVFKSIKGMFQLKQNYRDAFQLEAFNEKFIEECFDRYLYIVGDISSGILRLKGFDSDPKSVNYFGKINEYLDISCVFGCPFYVLKRIRTEEEFAKLEAANEPVDETGGVEIVQIKKENFDKESLILKSTPKTKPNIIIDVNKINAMPVGKLAPDLEEFVKQDKASSPKVVAQPKEDVPTTSYVSSSPDFDPSKSNSQRFNRNRNDNNNNNQNRNKQRNRNNQNQNQNQNKNQNNNSNNGNNNKQNNKNNKKDNK